MANEPELIRRQMQETRSCLAAKLETLEVRVADAVDGVAETVTHTADAVKSTVRESVHSVQDALDLKQQLEHRPWTAFVASTCVGYVCGRMLAGHESASSNLVNHSGDNGSGNRIAASRVSAPLSSMFASLEPEVRKLKELGIGLLFGLARDFVKDIAAPSVKAQLSEVIDDVTVRLGGRPLQSPVIKGMNGNPGTAANGNKRE